MSTTINLPPQEGDELDSLENGRAFKKAKDTLKRNFVDGNHGYLVQGRNTLAAYISKHRKVVNSLILVLLNCIVLVYFGFASDFWYRERKSSECGIGWCNGYGMLVLLLVFTYGGLCYYYIVKRFFGNAIIRCCQPGVKCIGNLQNTKYGVLACKMLIYLSFLIAIIIFLIFDTVQSRNRLISCVGVITILILGWIFSKHPARINWRPVLCGLIVQVICGLLTIRWPVGRAILQCISDKVVTFLEFAKEGAIFIFSEPLVKNGIFAFSVLPVLFFFGFMIQILYYLGAMQWIIMKIGWGLQVVIGTTLCESLNCAANIFIGMTESPLLIKPYITKLTSSEIHAVMCVGFATVSGTVLAAYIGFGAQPSHLLTASVMSAPASLCFSKLFYPETEESLTKSDNIELEKSEDSGILDAATKGALSVIPMALGIIANIIAFVSFIAFIDALLMWFGGLVGHTDLTFEWILSKIFMPLSWIMGVPWDHCEDVGKLIGLKTIINEFVAFKKLGELKKLGRIYGRTEAIATYAICGFANPSSIGILLGGLSALAPEKREKFAEIVIRAFFAGSAVSFLTASTAGMLISDDFNGIVSNSTTAATIII